MKFFAKVFSTIFVLFFAYTSMNSYSAFAEMFPQTFFDVTSGDYYYEAVEQLVEDGVLSHDSDYFYPDKILQRDESTKLAVNGAGLVTTGDGLSNFADVPSDSWFYPFVNIAVSNGVVSGYSHRPGYFGPADFVTRGQMAKIIVNAFDLGMYIPDSPTFFDVRPDMWEYPYVETAYHWSVINGYGNGYFGPADGVTRGDAALMIYRAKYDKPIETDYFTTKEFNLEVVFFDEITSCYVARKCEDGDTCSSIKDYRAPYSTLFTFKDGSLMVVDKKRANDYDFGEDGKTLKYCTSSEIPTNVISDLESYINTVSNLVYSWSNHGMKIVPHFHTINADLFSGLLNKENNGNTGYETGKTAPIEIQASYALKAGIDIKNMDFIIFFENAYPNSNSENPGLLVQQYVGGTYGMFNGIPIITMLATERDFSSGEILPQNRGWIIPAMIHEMIHVINIGHYSVSGLTDVFGIQNREQGVGYNASTNPRPHCYSTQHVVDGKPDPHKYFPDSYNWLDPMWNNNPYQTYTKSSDYNSYCLDDSYISNSSVVAKNPLDPTDTYSDISGLTNTAKYYKFVFQAHYQDYFDHALDISFCKNNQKDKGPSYTDFGNYFEFSKNTGGICSSKYYECNSSSGLCFDLDSSDTSEDSYNEIPVKREGDRVTVSVTDLFGDLDELTIETTVNFDDLGQSFIPLFTNVDRYYLAVRDGKIVFGAMDQYMRYDYSDKNTNKEIVANDLVVETGKDYSVQAVLRRNGSMAIYVDGELVASEGSGYFEGYFMPQIVSDSRAFVYIGYTPAWGASDEQTFDNGEIKNVKFYNKAQK